MNNTNEQSAKTDSQLAEESNITVRECHVTEVCMEMLN